MSGPIDHLREIALRCRSCEPLDEDHSQWLGSALQDFLSRDCQSIEDGLGLKFPQGGIPWWREEANRMRDAALRELPATCADASAKHQFAGVVDENDPDIGTESLFVNPVVAHSNRYENLNCRLLYTKAWRYFGRLD